jgi:hypothetical protein
MKRCKRMLAMSAKKCFIIWCISLFDIFRFFAMGGKGHSCRFCMFEKALFWKIAKKLIHAKKLSLSYKNKVQVDIWVEG